MDSAWGVQKKYFDSACGKGTRACSRLWRRQGWWCHGADSPVLRCQSNRDEGKKSHEENGSWLILRGPKYKPYGLNYLSYDEYTFLVPSATNYQCVSGAHIDEDSDGYRLQGLAHIFDNEEPCQISIFIFIVVLMGDNCSRKRTKTKNRGVRRRGRKGCPQGVTRRDPLVRSARQMEQSIGPGVSWPPHLGGRVFPQWDDTQTIRLKYCL